MTNEEIRNLTNEEIIARVEYLTNSLNCLTAQIWSTPEEREVYRLEYKALEAEGKKRGRFMTRCTPSNGGCYIKAYITLKK